MNMYSGSETKHALENFPFSYPPVHKELIQTIVMIKKAAAIANEKDGGISPEIAESIVWACDQIATGNYDDQFVTSALQGGAGTSMHMNVNEVIASLAAEFLEKKGKKQVVHPLDHVNKSQSTNDVNPSALKLASYLLLENLEQTLGTLISMLDQKISEWQKIPKLARTHLQDAVPTTVGAEFASYRSILARHGRRLTEMKPYLLELNLGGTAIGNSINASETYRTAVYQELASLTKLPVTPLANFMSGTSSQTDFVELSHVLVSLFVDLSKIANDIRLLVSGPRGGLGELKLPELQIGSSIMPGKVNPVIPEVVSQTYFLLSGYAVTIQQAAQASQLELGIMFPILADTLITSLILSQQVIEVFTKKCISVLIVNEARCFEHLNRSAAFATLLTPVLGHEAVSDVVREAVNGNKTIIDVLKEKNLYDEKIEKVLGK